MHKSQITAIGKIGWVKDAINGQIVLASHFEIPLQNTGIGNEVTSVNQQVLCLIGASAALIMFVGTVATDAA